MRVSGAENWVRFGVASGSGILDSYQGTFRYTGPYPAARVRSGSTQGDIDPIRHTSGISGGFRQLRIYDVNLLRGGRVT